MSERNIKVRNGRAVRLKSQGKYCREDILVEFENQEGGFTLPDLANPGAASDLASGKELIDQDGNVITGTLHEVLPGKVIGSSQNPTVSRNSSDGGINIFAELTTMDAIARAGALLRASAPGSAFGNARADQVAKGATFTSENGLQMEGTHECEAGTVLAPLEDPATPTDMLSGKTLYDDQGNPVTGTLVEADEIQEKLFATSDYSFGGTPGDTVFHVSGMYNSNLDGVIVRPGAGLGVRSAPTEFFGNAQPNQVAKGAIFTSAAGLKMEGTHECEGGVTLPELGDTAAQPTDMALGKVLYDDEGNPVTGELYEILEGKVIAATEFQKLMESSGGTISTLAAMNVADAVVRKNSIFRATAPSSAFGNATADQVAKGATFTSAAGLLVEGTLETGSGGVHMSVDGETLVITGAVTIENETLIL